MRISDWSSDVCSSDLDLVSRLPSGLEPFFVGTEQMRWYPGTHMFGFAARGDPALDRAPIDADQVSDARRGMTLLAKPTNFLLLFAATSLSRSPDRKSVV